MKTHSLFALLLILAAGKPGLSPARDRAGNGTPPFGGTIFIDPDIITESDPTVFDGLESAGQAALYSADGILEETLVHEAAHTSLDADHASAAGCRDSFDLMDR